MGHCVGRGSASASPDGPWFVPFPAHSYVIICDKLLCSQATTPRQWPGLPNNSEKATCTCTQGLDVAWTHTQAHTHKDAQMRILTHLLTLRFAQTKLWAAVSSGFCILEPKEWGYNPGGHIDTQQSSADFSGSCRAQHFPLSTLSSSKPPWQRTCWYPLLCQNRYDKKSCLYFLAVNNFGYSELNRQTSALFCSIHYDLLLCLFYHLSCRHCLYHYN